MFNNKIILKSQQRFKSKAHNVYTEEINKISLSSNDHKRLQTFDKISTYPYETIAFKACKCEMLRKYKWLIWWIVIKRKQNSAGAATYNLKWLYIPDHPYRILIIGDSGSGKTNALLNLINNQPDIDKIYLYAKDPFEAKYQFLIKEKAQN